MRKIASILISTIVFFTGCVKQEKGEFNVAKRLIPKEEKHFVVLTLSYNNEAFVEKNADSVLSQTYPNFTWIYIDDCSTDATFEKISGRASHFPNVKIQRNEKNMGAMANMYHAIHALDPHDVVVILDGDDWFSHERVLEHLNEYYANEDVWLTYGQHIEYPSFTVGLCQPLKKKYLKPGGFRKAKFLFSHLRTFYAGLFQKIEKGHFMKNGAFLEMGCDVASMLPMLEMAGEHAYFIRELMMMYNMRNPLSDAKKNLALQQDIEQYIRTLPVYSTLNVSPYEAEEY